MKDVLGMSHDEMADTFEEWNKGELDSFLVTHYLHSSYNWSQLDKHKYENQTTLGPRNQDAVLRTVIAKNGT